MSQNIPTVCFNDVCYAMGTLPHTWQAVAQRKSSLAHKGMTYAAHVLAATAIELMETPELVEEAKVDFVKAMNGTTYESLIPTNMKPTV